MVLNIGATLTGFANSGIVCIRVVLLSLMRVVVALGLAEVLRAEQRVSVSLFAWSRVCGPTS